jgi:uncharacterized protein YndB with AHSA1/START domain
MTTKIKIQAQVNTTIDKVWEAWTNPKHIIHWNFATSDWHCPAATNELKVGGKFSTTMASKNGEFSFEFGGVYEVVEYPSLLAYTLEDGRKVKAMFEPNAEGVLVTELFDPEDQNPIELQKAGWQSILNNFKTYAEQLG